MTDPNFIILYVDSPAISAQFYTDLLGKQPIDASPAFVMFALGSGAMLGLWSRQNVQPAPTASVGGNELAFSVANNDEVDSIYADWCSRRLEILQKPTQLGFGYTFVVLDPDGHRLRVFAPSQR